VLAELRDLDGLRALADAGDISASMRLADLLAEREDLDGAMQIQRSQAHAGQGNARQLARLLTQQGRRAEAERLHRFGLSPDGSIASE
jgi:hypothetical protein